MGAGGPAVHAAGAEWGLSVLFELIFVNFPLSSTYLFLYSFSFFLW